MSNTTMNIQLNKVTGKCDEKCRFKYKYITSSTCVATNNANYFSLSYDQSSTNPVTFNNNEYIIESINIYFNSVHYFNGSPATGEFVITHACSSNMSNKLIICIPLSNTSGTPNNLLNSILNNISSVNITNGYNSDLKLDSDYNLNNIVQNKPFYYYKENTNNEFICYGLTNAIYISSDLVNNITSLITPPSNNLLFISVPDLFYNKQGPIQFTEDEIYIDCQPVNSSGNELILFNNKNNSGGSGGLGSSSGLGSQNYILLIIFGCFICAILLYVFTVNKLVKTTTTPTTTKPQTQSSLLEYIIKYLLH